MDISNVQGVRSDINEMLSKIREMSNKSSVFDTGGASSAAEPPKFGDALSAAKSAIGNVSQVQTAAEHVQNAYVMGDSSVSMSQVVVASQKSKLAFEGLLTVRNKILDAYKEIMSMPI